MEQAFAPIVDYVSRLSPTSVFYWDCRNGALLYTMRVARPGTAVGGTDPDADRIARARLLLPSEANRLWTRSIGDLNALENLEAVDIVILMAGRLGEMSEECRQRFIHAAFRVAGRVLVYAHRDWLRNKDLGEYLHGLGLSCVARVEYGGCVGELRCAST